MKDNEINNLRHSYYNAWDYYNNNPCIKRVVDSLVDGTFHESREEFRMIFDELMNRNDEYFLFADFEAYVEAQEKSECFISKSSITGLRCVWLILQNLVSSHLTVQLKIMLKIFGN